jgi:hypothetical protein
VLSAALTVGLLQAGTPANQYDRQLKVIGQYYSAYELIDLYLVVVVEECMVL